MELMNKLRLFIEGMEEREFYRYMIILLGLIVLMAGFLVFRYYKKVGALEGRIEYVNDEREEKVQSILQRMHVVSQQRKHVNDILAKDKEFRIAGYFDELLKKLGLFDKRTAQSSSEVVLGPEYSEIMLRASFVGLNMRQLTELLEKIEKNERVYEKSLEIIRSTRTPKTIDVNLTIATLEPRLRAGA